MTAEDYVASKYPDGYRRVHHGYFPEGEDYKTRYPEDGTTLSNTLFFRCSKCNTNVKWSLTSCIHTLEIKRRS